MPTSYYTVESRNYDVKFGHANDGTVITALLPRSLVMHRVPDTGRTLILSRPLVVLVCQDSDGVWSCHEPYLAIDGYGMTYWSAVNDFHREFLWLWDEIANGDSSKLDLVAQELKESMRVIVEERKVESLDNSARHETYRYAYTTNTKGIYAQEWQTRSRNVSAIGGRQGDQSVSWMES